MIRAEEVARRASKIAKEWRYMTIATDEHPQLRETPEYKAFYEKFNEVMGMMIAWNVTEEDVRELQRLCTVALKAFVEVSPSTVSQLLRMQSTFRDIGF